MYLFQCCYEQSCSWVEEANVKRTGGKVSGNTGSHVYGVIVHACRWGAVPVCTWDLIVLSENNCYFYLDDFIVFGGPGSS